MEARGGRRDARAGKVTAFTTPTRSRGDRCNKEYAPEALSARTSSDAAKNASERRPISLTSATSTTSRWCDRRSCATIDVAASDDDDVSGLHAASKC